MLKSIYKPTTVSALLATSLCVGLNVVSYAAPTKSSTKIPANDKTRQTLSARVSTEVQEADKLMARGKYSEAEELYHQALNSNSKDVAARAGYGLALAKGFKLDRAQEEFDKTLKDDPKNALAHCGKALIDLNRLQSSNVTTQKNRASLLRDAGEECNKAFDSDTKVPEVHYTLGLVFKEEGRLDKAEQAFNGALKIDPKYSDALTGLGLVKLQQNNLTAAAENFKQAVAQNSGNSTAHFGLGQTYLRQNQLDQAISELNTSLYQNTNSSPVHLCLGRAYELQGNSVAAVKEYQESARIKPENPSAYLGLANIREARGDIELAMAEVRSGLELSPNSPDLHLRIATDSMKVEKLDDAIKEYETALSLAPSNANAIDGLTTAYYLKSQKETAGGFIATNDFQKADEMIKKAIGLNPNSLQLRLAQAKLKSLAGEPVNLNATGVPTNDGERIEMAEALLAQNKFDGASTQMNTVISNTRTARDAMAVGDLALMIKDLSSAEGAYKKACTMADNKDQDRAKRGLANVAKARDKAKQQQTLADDLAKRKQLASAIDNYHGAIFANPRQANAHYGLSEALERLYPDTPSELRESSTQLRAYMALTPNLPAKESEKIQKHITKLEEKAFKIDQKIAKKHTAPNVVAQR
jgi:tetratricopeptide (TPR) repeat protein